MNKTHLLPIIQALAAALLFGVSAPMAKLLLGEIAPVPLAAFLYLGSGISLLGLEIIQNRAKDSAAREARLKRNDLPWLVGAILAGGVAAPIALLFSLQSTPAATASLLLNFEAVATTLIALIIFKEAIGRRAWGAVGIITLSSILLSININGAWGFSLGAFGILLACILWGIDNNLTRNISAKDPVMIVTIKGLGAGVFSLALAIVLGYRLPGLPAAIGAMIIGGLCYGASIVLFIFAMRSLGAARTSALLSTAPLAGVILSFILFHETVTWLFLVALPLMVAGTLLLVNEKHGHYHVHEMIIHDHLHDHTDGHHDHPHLENSLVQHSHEHEHGEVAHEHEHLPDLHHRHSHPPE